MSIPLCGSGKHPRIPENRTKTDRCKLCALDHRRAASDRNREARRAQKDRERTARNLELRNNRTTADDCHLEHLRATKIFALMDSLELAQTGYERRDIQHKIKELSGGIL